MRFTHPTLLVSAIVVFAASSLRACPFCTPLAAPLAERREAADVAGLAELVSVDDAIARLKLRHLAKGAAPLAVDTVLELPAKELAIPRDAKPGSLWLVFGTKSATDDVPTKQTAAVAAGLDWSAEPVNETVYGYFVRAPGLRVPSAERLRYYARYLEHAEPLVGSDVYNEFGLAPLDVVAKVVDELPLAKMRDWLVDPAVPGGRKGFYGVALGLATDEQDRAANRKLLESLVDQAGTAGDGPAAKPGSDFRAGFDGALGGLLLLTGVDGLDRIEKRILDNPRAAEGDARHAVAALRFAHEYVPGIPRERLAGALARVLSRPGFAATAITDLARWQAWDELPAVVACYREQGGPADDDVAAAVRYAVIGYLSACPSAKAKARLAALRREDPAGVAAAERLLGQGFGPSALPRRAEP
ncbi:MAG: hypothetical protein K2Y37_18665 [Pirellulales bacterium]|nr:hypothetical protein [Pirellulales bacterium]